MRVGDFGLELVGRDSDLREAETGHVLARAGAVYSIRLRNFGPLRCVVGVEIDGKFVTGGGLVVMPYGVCTLERPVDDTEHGRFTVVAEGDESVFGPDGGRDNADLGLIDASFRRELPTSGQGRFIPTSIPMPSARPMPGSVPPRMRPARPPEGTPPGWQNQLRSFDNATPASPPSPASFASAHAPMSHPEVAEWVQESHDSLHRAAGTGLTGRSDQEFTTVSVGALEKEMTTLRLRLVIGTEEEIAAPRPLRATDDAPVRPVARP